MTKRLSIDQLEHFPIEDSLALPLDRIVELLAEIASTGDRVKLAAGWVNRALDLRFKDRAALLRQSEGKDFGVVHVEEDGFQITCELEKKVEWNQAKLAGAVLALQAGGEKPRDYVDVTYKVTETRYKAWPERIRKIFDPARSAKPGTAKYRLDRKPAGA